MKDLDFLEIGTSDFHTAIQKCADNHVGIVVEPVEYYLNNLPNRPNVIKINAAVAIDNQEGSCDVYYVPPVDITKYNLPGWLRGCNRINEYHPQHINLGVQELVVKEKVASLPLAKILKDHAVRKIALLKIDTEGADCRILLSLFAIFKTGDMDITCLPRQIIFENNSLTDAAELDSVLKDAIELGYVAGNQNGDELILNYVNY